MGCRRQSGKSKGNQIHRFVVLTTDDDVVGPGQVPVLAAGTRKHVHVRIRMHVAEALSYRGETLRQQRAA